MIRQTLALFADAYRELAAGKIFWITMVLNVLVVAVFSMIGIDEDGISFLVWDVPGPPLTSALMPPDLLYKTMLTTFGVPIWLGWAATILGLISTAGIIPGFVSGGTIEVHLSKPIGRARLFLTKYISGLFFMGLQVGVFSFGVFLLIGLRGGDWEPRVFIAVPVLLAMFSFLFSVSALIGLLTRSSVAALLLTILFWLVVFLTNTADDILLQWRVTAEIRHEQSVTQVEEAEQLARESLEAYEEAGESLPPPEEWAPGIRDELEAANPLLSNLRIEQESHQESMESARKWHGYIVVAKTIIPKTQETIALLERSLLSEEDYEQLLTNASDDEVPAFGETPVSIREMSRRFDEAKRGRTLAWVLGTSFLFEGLILLIATTIFSRRDY